MNKRFMMLLEGGLWFAGLTCLVFVARTRLEARQAQHIAQRFADQRSTAKAVASNGVIGKLDIPSLTLSVPITGDYDSESLIRGVGHIPGTAVPGGLGNLVLVGHRDTFFRPLRKVRDGMKIEVTTASGRWQYQIDSTEIVLPEQVGVLEIGSRPEMTLITCFPFDFVGAAPKRFVVHAHLLSADSM